MRDRKKKLFTVLSLFLPVYLYVSGLAAQLLRNFRIWQEAGSSYTVSPGLPSLRPGDVLSALWSFPEGLAGSGAVLLGLAVCILLLRGFPLPASGIRDRDRNLTISGCGSYGTAAFLTDREAARCFRISEAQATDRDILGMVPGGRVFTLPPGTRLNANIAVCGASGTGKSRSISRNLIFQAVRRGESLICTDPKSELYESMSPLLREEGYEVRIFNLVQMDHSDSWDCLGEIEGDELMAQIFADVVMKNTSGRLPDAFWYHAELNLLKALILYVSLEMPPEKRTLAQVYELLTEEDDRSLNRLMEGVRYEHRNVYTNEILPPSPACAPFSVYRQSGENVRSNVIIGLGSKLQVLQSRLVKEITSHREIDLELPGKTKCAYFCIVSDQDSTFEFLSSLFFSFLFIKLIRYADTCGKNGMLDTKVKFVLDEFTNCLQIPDFTKKCSVVRSRGCELAIFFQNIGQMRNRYPEDQWQEILGACDTTVFLGCTDLMSAEYFSTRAGVASVEVEATAREMNALRLSDYTPSYRRTRSLGRRPLLTPDEILRLPPEEELVFIRGQRVFRAGRFDYTLHPMYGRLKSEKAVQHVPLWRRESAGTLEGLSEEENASGHGTRDGAENNETEEYGREEVPLGRKIDIREIM